MVGKQKHIAGLKHLHIAAVLKLERRFWPVMFLLCLLCCELKIRPSYLRAGYNQGLALSSKSDSRYCSGSRDSVIIDGTGPDYFHCPTNDGHHCREQREIRREKWDSLSVGSVNGASVPFLTSITKHIYFTFTFLFLAGAFLPKLLSPYDFLFSVEHKRRCLAECPSCSFTSILWKRAAWTLC